MNLQLLVDLHRPNQRLGPGGDDQSRQALALAGLDRPSPGLRVADLGCGTGASTLALAKALDATITAVDLFPEFLGELEARAKTENLHDRINTLTASMAELPFDPASFDLIWAEGSAYNIGFERSLQSWRPLLADGGLLAISELTWLTQGRPPELQAHWDSRYPEVDTAAAKIRMLEEHGYCPLGYFVLPERCWLDNYFEPLRARFQPFLEAHEHSEEAKAVVADEELEMSMYAKYQEFVGYGFYVARKTKTLKL